MGNSLLWQVVGKNDWRAVADLDSFTWVYDHLPPKMRLAVDFKIQGFSNKKIAKLMSITEHTLRQHLAEAKKRFIEGENIEYQQWGREN